MFNEGFDSTSMSGGTSTNEENESDYSERCVTENSSQDFPPASCSKSGNVDVKETERVAKLENSNESHRRSLVENSEAVLPIFSIKFRNENIARKYREEVKKFLKELITKHEPTDESCNISDLELDIWEDSGSEGKQCPENAPLSNEDDVDMAKESAVNPSKRKAAVQDKQPECITVPDDTDLFVIDKRPTTRDGRDVPSYRQRRSYKMLAEKVAEAEVSSSDASPKRIISCFNCQGNHNLRDCPKRRNQANINRNRRDFGGKQTGRYHVDEEQKYASFVPGKLSDDLRHALGLRRNELPRHIYRMRLLGYPPGWLAATKVRHSGISVFNEQGKEVLHSDDEEGELISEEMKVKYDPSKLIEFPGFNVPPPPDTRDEWRRMHCPPLQGKQSLGAMMTQLGPTYMGGKQRRKKAVQGVKPATQQSDQDLTTADMDVESVPSEASLRMLPGDDNCRFIPPLPIGTPPQFPPPPPAETPPRPPALSSMESDSEGVDTRSQEAASPLSTGHSSVSSPRAQSPSLSELESKKALLLAELEDGASSDTGSTTLGTPRRAVGTTTHHTPVTLGKVKNVSLGTPLLNSSSPFKRLPEPLSFSKDVSNMIIFENLPDSTGAYEKMTGVIQKVRMFMSHDQDQK